MKMFADHTTYASLLNIQVRYIPIILKMFNLGTVTRMG